MTTRQKYLRLGLNFWLVASKMLFLLEQCATVVHVCRKASIAAEFH